MVKNIVPGPDKLRHMDEKDYKSAKDYLSSISGYKDADNLYSQMDDYITYYEALEYESVSIVGAVEIYKTLPSDFLDVSKRIAKYKPYIDCVGTFGNTNYLLKGIRIKDFSIDSNGEMILQTNIWDMEMDYSNKEGYLFSVTWKKYDRVYYFSQNKVVVYEDGKEYCTWTR